MKESSQLLSLVLPVYNNKALACQSCAELDRYLCSLNIPYEIILVDDGSLSAQRVSLVDLPKTVKLIQLERNRGKGYAVRQGMLNASGYCRIFTDIDLPFDLCAIKHAYNLVVERGFDFVAGDRSLYHSQFKIKQPFLRKLASRIFSKFITLFVIGGIYDSQCGFKAFSGRLAHELFPLLTIERFSFDVEIYYLLLKYNVLIKRIPVRLNNAGASTVNILKHAWEMSLEIASIPIKWRLGKYHCDKLWDFEEHVYWE